MAVGLTADGGNVLTGLEPWKRSAGGVDAYMAGEGSSGGLVADINAGEVDAISITVDATYSTANATKQTYGVTFNAAVGTETGIFPIAAGIEDSNVIRLALSSLVYRQALPTASPVPTT